MNQQQYKFKYFLKVINMYISQIKKIIIIDGFTSVPNFTLDFWKYIFQSVSSTIITLAHTGNAAQKETATWVHCAIPVCNFVNQRCLFRRFLVLRTVFLWLYVCMEDLKRLHIICLHLISAKRPCNWFDGSAAIGHTTTDL